MQRPHECEIIDIGGSKLNDSHFDALQQDFIKGRNGVGHYVPDVLTFCDRGLEIWSDVTSLPAWYQTREEIGLLERHGPKIARYIPQNASLFDLGSGDVKKIIPLLDIIEALERPITYYSVDLSRSSIARGLGRLSSRYKHIALVGLWGSFDDARAYLKQVVGPYFFVCLGAEIGNDTFKGAVSDLSAWRDLMRPGDHFLLGIDGTQDKSKVWSSYHDVDGIVHQFIRSGMLQSNDVLGTKWFKEEEWAMTGKFWNDPFVHRFVFTARCDVRVGTSLLFREGDQVFCYESHRNTPTEMQAIFQACSLEVTEIWSMLESDICEYLLTVKD